MQIEIIKIGDIVTSAYPTGRLKTGLLPGFSNIQKMISKMFEESDRYIKEFETIRNIITVNGYWWHRTIWNISGLIKKS